MPRMARVVVPGLPHHVTQRGNRRQRTFFSADHYQTYLSLLRAWAPRTGVRIWAYCLMPNHVHLIVVPAHGNALAACMREVHSRYSLQINAERDWRGHLWQARFASFVMDPAYAVAAARYVAMNPVRAGLVAQPNEWSYSSVGVHLGLAHDGIVDTAGYGGLVDDWPALLACKAQDDVADRLRRHARTGRPLGSESFVQGVEAKTGRANLMRARGRPRGDKW